MNHTGVRRTGSRRHARRKTSFMLAMHGNGRARTGGVQMRLCLMVEGQEGVTWDQWLALAQACEEHGLEGMFRSDHYTGFHAGEAGSLDAWTTLGAIAARTDRIRLGTLVSPATFRHPSVLARAAATVDRVSAGRVELGMGAGGFE